MNKKLLATVLASTMILGSMSVSAATVPTATSGVINASGAAGTADASKAIPVIAKMEPVVIDVELPAEMEILFNPYKLDITDQIASPIYTITNKGKTAVNATLTNWEVKIESGDTKLPVTLATAPIATSSTKKEVFMVLQKGGKSGEAPAGYTADNVKADKSILVPAKVGTNAVSMAYGTLPSGSGTLQMQFQGEMNPKVVWLSGDKITAAPTFKFEPTISVVTTP